jgi:hypothetical protein
MPFKEITGLFSESYETHTQNKALLTVKAGGTYSYNRAFQD